jgi:anti-sigma factor RsiW
VTTLARACRPHRGVLEALVERGERGPDVAAALDHLEACAVCERELTELALTIAALRRAGSELRAAHVPDPSPARVVALAAPPPGRWSWRIQLGGLLTGAAIAALVVFPRAGTGAPRASDALPVARPAVTASWRLAEAHLALTPDTPPFSARETTVPPRYPDGLLKPWKEVPSTDAVPRERMPI